MGTTVSQVRQEIENFLGIDPSCILIGAGNLGRAIATHISNNFAGFELTAIFDTNNRVAGMQIADCPILPYDELKNFCE